MKPPIQDLMANLPETVIHHIQHLERMRQDFVANVSHELRTPLTVIHGYLETLLHQDSEETKPLRKIFMQMQQQTQRMENLIEDLLLLSRLENEEDDDIEKSIVNVPKLLKAIYKEAKVFSGEQKHHFQLKVEKKLFIEGNPFELRSLFSNIIFNAVKYTPAEGNIIIRWVKKNNKIYFSVKDTGIGIAAKHIPRLTERFYRVDKSRSRASGGTGLGLAIAKHVLLRHDAKLTVESKVGVGSTFTCVFNFNL